MGIYYLYLFLPFTSMGAEQIGGETLAILNRELAKDNLPPLEVDAKGDLVTDFPDMLSQVFWNTRMKEQGLLGDLHVHQKASSAPSNSPAFLQPAASD